MITLPTYWKDRVQVRRWIAPTDKHKEWVAMVLLPLMNSDGEIMRYESIKMPPESTSEERLKALKDKYDELLDVVPGWAKDIDIVYTPDGKEIPITSDDFSVHILPSVAGFELYTDYIEQLESDR